VTCYYKTHHHSITEILLKVALNTNKTDHHSIAEIMWKVALNTNKTDHYGIVLFLHFDDTFLAHLTWFSGFRGEDINVIFYQNMPNLQYRYKSAERKLCPTALPSIQDGCCF
jgi:hypothetical protein